MSKDMVVQGRCNHGISRPREETARVTYFIEGWVDDYGHLNLVIEGQYDGDDVEAAMHTPASEEREVYTLQRVEDAYRKDIGD